MIESSPAPKSARLWTATSATKDFRKSPWTSSPLEVGARIVGEVPSPADGNVALFGDLVYEIDGLPYHLSTQIRQAPARK